jgi:hypothetical protein
LDANNTALAESGFHGIRRKAHKKKRLRIEATFFLGICYLRQKKLQEAKTVLRIVLSALNQEKSSKTRQFLQKRIIERIEEESILTELIGVEDGTLRKEDIHNEAVKLVQKTEDELFELLGRNIPYRAFALLQDVRNDAILHLSIADRKLLPPAGYATQERQVGKRAFEALKRVGWNTLCDPKSPIYKLWSQKMPQVYTGGYFAAAVFTAFQDWHIGLPFLAAGLAAIAMKYAATEFCDLTRPESIMETRRKKA